MQGTPNQGGWLKENRHYVDQGLERQGEDASCPIEMQHISTVCVDGIMSVHNHEGSILTLYTLTYTGQNGIWFLLNTEGALDLACPERWGGVRWAEFALVGLFHPFHCDRQTKLSPPNVTDRKHKHLLDPDPVQLYIYTHSIKTKTNWRGGQAHSYSRRGEVTNGRKQLQGAIFWRTKKSIYYHTEYMRGVLGNVGMTTFNMESIAQLSGLGAYIVLANTLCMRMALNSCS